MAHPDPPLDQAPIELAVIVVTYQSARHLPGLLESVPAAADGLRVRVLVVDNGSRDESVRIARGYDGVAAIETGANLGFAGGINVGLRHLPPDVPAVAILNPDLRLTPGSLRVLTRALTRPGVAVAVPKILDDAGSVYLSLFADATLRSALGDALFGARFPRRHPAWTQAVRDPTRYERPGPAECPSGAAWVVRTDVLRELGDWDESYFLYSEEFEYARRVRAAGYRIRYCPDAVVHHAEHGSGTNDDLAALLSINKVRDFERHHGRVASGAFRAVTALHHLLRVRQPASRRVLRLLPHRERWRSFVERLQGAPADVPATAVAAPSAAVPGIAVAVVAAAPAGEPAP